MSRGMLKVMISRNSIEDMIKALPGVVLDYPFGEEAAVYFVDDGRWTMDDRKAQKKVDATAISVSSVQHSASTRKMFALIADGSQPVRLSLKCDPQLAELLREKYETVLPGHHLNKKHWNTILCTGQVPEDELRDLIRHSYELARAQAP